MENNSNSALRIRLLIMIVYVLIIWGTSTQLFCIAKNNIEIAKGKNIQQGVEVAETTQNYERNVKVTARSEAEREFKQENSQKENNNIAKAKLKEKTIEEVKISRDMDLTITTGLSKENFKKLMTDLKVDTSGFFEENSDIIYDLCQEYEINEIFFCGLIAAESGWNIASNHRNTNNYISMMSGGSLIKYSSPEEGLEAAAKLLHNRYLTPGGSCYFGKTISAVQTRFCPNSSTWVGLVYGCMSQVIK